MVIAREEVEDRRRARVRGGRARGESRRPCTRVYTRARARSRARPPLQRGWLLAQQFLARARSEPRDMLEHSWPGVRQLCVAYAWLLAGCCATRDDKPSRKNVLLLICDDLRTQLKSYGHADYMHTPNIDKLAADALVFDRAYTNYPYCAPSRNSFMSCVQTCVHPCAGSSAGSRVLI